MFKHLYVSETISECTSEKINAYISLVSIHEYRYVSFKRIPIYRNSRYTGHFPWEHSRSIFSITIYRKFRISDSLYARYFRCYIRYIVCKKDVPEAPWAKIRIHKLRIISHEQNIWRDCGYMQEYIIGKSDYTGSILCKLFCCVVSCFIFVLLILFSYYFLFCYFFLLFWLVFLLFLIIFDLFFLLFLIL